VTHDLIFGIVSSKTAVNSAHTVPFLRDSDFVGREKILRLLDAEFSSQDSSSRVALVGLGGMG